MSSYELNVTKLSDEQKITQSHEYLMAFLNKYHASTRGGIHDFIETNIANMIGQAIADIDTYLQTGHKQVVANEIMCIAVQSFQKVLDGVKRNLERINTVNFK